MRKWHDIYEKKEPNAISIGYFSKLFIGLPFCIFRTYTLIIYMKLNVFFLYLSTIAH